jgi:hypothetical protein
MSVWCVCCVFSGRGLCDELITRPEVDYRVWHVVMCDHKTSWTRRPQTALGYRASENDNDSNIINTIIHLLKCIAIYSTKRPNCNYVNSTKMDLQEVGCGGMDWIELAHDRNRERHLWKW